MGGSKVPAETTQRTIQEVPPYVQRAQQTLFDEATRVYRTYQPQQYGGAWTSAVTAQPDYQTAAQYEQGLAQRAIPRQIEATQSTLGALMNAPDVYQNPALQRAVRGALGDVQRQYTEGIIPQLESSIAGGGQGGNVRTDILRQKIGERAAREMSDVAAGMYERAYGTGLEAAARGAQMQPGLLQMMMAPGEVYRRVGRDITADQQAQIDQLRNMYEYQQMAPWSQLQRISAIMGGGGGGGGGGLGGSSSTTGPYQGPIPKSPLSGLLGGGLAGAGTAAGLVGAGMMGATSPWIWPIVGAGALAGAL